jgi:predicted dehydrogenase
MDTVRVGFVGCGGHSTTTLYPNFRLIPELDLVAVCDLQEHLARRNARLFGASAWYTDFDTMLASEEIDALFIVGEPSMHEELGAEGFGRGYHVFTEKPTSLTVEGARRLAEAHRASGRVGQCGHMMRHSPSLVLAKRIIESEQFGPLNFLESKYFTPGPNEPIWGLPTAEWSYMLCQAIHPVDLARHVGGEIARVSAVRCGPQRQVYVVAVEFEGGAAGLLNLNGSAPNWETRLEATGDNFACVVVENMTHLRYETTAPWPAEFGSELTQISSRNWQAPTRDNSEVRPGYAEEMRHFARAILEGRPAYPSFEDECRNYLVCEAILRSCSEGRAISPGE